MPIVSLSLIDSSKLAHQFTSCGNVDLPHNSQLTIVRALGHSPTPRVFLATLTSTCTSPSNALNLVVKLASNIDGISSLHVEEWAYKRLEELQGVSIPLCYGLFEGRIHGEAVKFLLLEYCVPDRFLLADPKEEMQQQIMLRMFDIHQKGLQYGKFLDSSHIIVQDGSSRIISFSDAVPHGPSCNGSSWFYIDSDEREVEWQCCCREVMNVAFSCGFNIKTK